MKGPYGSGLGAVGQKGRRQNYCILTEWRISRHYFLHCSVFIALDINSISELDINNITELDINKNNLK